jgi:hypothetical protein
MKILIEIDGDCVDRLSSEVMNGSAVHNLLQTGARTIRWINDASNPRQFNKWIVCRSRPWINVDNRPGFYALARESAIMRKPGASLSAKNAKQLFWKRFVEVFLDAG